MCPHSFFISVTSLSVNPPCFLLILLRLCCFFRIIAAVVFSFLIHFNLAYSNHSDFFLFCFIFSSCLSTFSSSSYCPLSLYLSLPVSLFLCWPWCVVFSFHPVFFFVFSFLFFFLLFSVGSLALITSVSMAGIASTCSSQTPFEYSYFTFIDRGLCSDTTIFSSISPRIDRLVSLSVLLIMMIIEHSLNFLIFLYFLIHL